MSTGIDVVTCIRIDRPLPAVVAYAADPSRAPEWYVNIKSVEWETRPEVREGARMTFVARFLGRQLQYTYEIVKYEPSQILVMRTTDGPFPMETTYEWTPLEDGATLMTLRNRGTPSGFSSLVRPILARAMKRATTKDLERLKEILERPARNPRH